MASSSTGRLRIGCDPLHRHLLPPEATARTAWRTIQVWSEQIRAGAVDGALISIAGLSVASALGDLPPEVECCGATELLAETDLASSGISALELGIRPLVLVHARCHRQAIDRGARSLRWELLLPPPAQQPLLWREFEQLALLPLQACQAADARAWLTRLRAGPHLLPADLSLLEQGPWHEAGLLAVPPPEPLAERLWLLVREGDPQPQLMGLMKTLCRRILRRH